jgi:hypothetical protein
MFASRLIALIFSVLFFCLTLSANAQNASSPVVDTPESVSNDTTVDPAPVACKPGINVGYMLIRQPNITSMFTIGNTYNVSWDWSISVSKPAQYVDMYVQLVAPGVQVTWKKKILEKQGTSPRWFMWKPDGLVDGKYKIRLVPDGKETYGVRADEQPCFDNGESIPSVSASFSISNPRGDLGNYPDPFPPNSAVGSKAPFFLICALFLLLLLQK